MAPALSDKVVSTVLTRYAHLAAGLVADPAAWLGTGGAGPSDDDGFLPLRAARAAGRLGRRALTGAQHPGTAGWAAQPLADRVDWWADRVAAVAAPLAATPRVAGALADRVPLQATLGAATQGLVVCAAAREQGLTDPADWVPLLGKVLLDRDLPRPQGPQDLPEEDVLADDAPGLDDSPTPVARGPLGRGGRALVRLARVLLELQGLFDERPRGRLAWRALGKLPVVGVAGGVLDERGGVRAAAAETLELLAAW